MQGMLKYEAWGLAAIVVIAVVGCLWACQVATSRYEKQWVVHAAGFPVPFPLNDDELAALRADRIAPGAAAATARTSADRPASTSRSSGTGWRQT